MILAILSMKSQVSLPPIHFIFLEIFFRKIRTVKILFERKFNRRNEQLLLASLTYYYSIKLHVMLGFGSILKFILGNRTTIRFVEFNSWSHKEFKTNKCARLLKTLSLSFELSLWVSFILKIGCFTSIWTDRSPEISRNVQSVL